MLLGFCHHRHESLPYLLTPWSTVLLEKLTRFQLAKKSMHLMEQEGSLPSLQEPTSCPYSEPDQSSPFPTLPSHFLKILLTIILPSMPGFSKWCLSPQISPPKPCMYLSPPPYMLLALPTSFFLIWLRIIFYEEYTLLGSSLCSFLHSPVLLSFLGPNIPLNTLFSHNHSLHSSLTVSDHVSHPYKTTGNIIILYILIIIFFG